MRQQPRSWVTTGAMTSSREWCLQTHSRPRPWWTLSEPWAGRTSPPSPQRAAMERRGWRLSHNSPKKQVKKTDQWWAVNRLQVFFCLFGWFLCFKHAFFFTRGWTVLHLQFVIKICFGWMNYWSVWQLLLSSPVSCWVLLEMERETACRKDVTSQW